MIDVEINDEVGSKRTGPSINRGNSKQDYVTPLDFMEAVVGRFGPIAVDLAATGENARGPIYIGKKVDSLTVEWAEKFRGNMWLNPEFDDITTWSKKCAEQSLLLKNDSRILMLVPASVGANWFVNWVKPFAYVLALQGRIKFEGTAHGFPKDLMLAIYGHGLKGFDTWKWRTTT